MMTLVIAFGLLLVVAANALYKAEAPELVIGVTASVGLVLAIGGSVMLIWPSIASGHDALMCTLDHSFTQCAMRPR